jgi:hypothetical protein
MSLYCALLSKRDHLYARLSPDALVDEYLLPLAGRIDKLEARIAALETSPAAPIFLGQDDPADYAPICEDGSSSPSDDLKHVHDARHNMAQERSVARNITTTACGSNLDLVTGAVW